MPAELSLLQLISVTALPLLFAITLHEVAHGWVALQLGDDTAKTQHRLSLNPLRHIDPIGTVLLPLGLLLISNLLGGGFFLFGWAKPVPVNWHKLRHPRRDMALVALAGPTANLLMAVGWLLIAKLGAGLDGGVAEFLWLSGTLGLGLNLVLMVLNLLPILPLDGGRVVFTLLPARWGQFYAQLEPYGLVLLLVLLMTDVLYYFLWPAFWLQHFFSTFI